PLAFPMKPGADSDGFVRVAHALYPFGYGLSYTDFEYSDLKIEQSAPGVGGSVTVSCKVTNTGDREGDEVVQLYLRDVVSSVTTYVKVLRGFERVSLRLGETKEVSFTLTPQDLGLWNKDGHFVVEPGEFKVMVGSSSEDIRLEGGFHVNA
ncbi:MAG: fibronectin type III-like domain-contianing protein, partial [Muribaculaceae bacterium]|nr:fibronectin type III-like domain-contianing protein [Muribaculaceae bacterium]